MISKAQADLAESAANAKMESDEARINDNSQIRVNFDEGSKFLKETIDNEKPKAISNIERSSNNFDSQVGTIQSEFDSLANTAQTEIEAIFDMKRANLDANGWSLEQLDQVESDWLAEVASRRALSTD